MMNAVGFHVLRAYGRWPAILAIVMSSASIAYGQGLTVGAINIDGQPAQSAAGVQVRMPGTAASQPQTLKSGQNITAGAEITVPRGMRLELASSNGNKIVLHPGARFVAGAVTAQGESHQPLAGRVDFQVRRALDFFNIQYDRITAAVKGTEYSVEIDPAKSLKISVSEGVVEVERQVQVRVAGMQRERAAARAADSEGSAVRVAEDLRAGGSKTYQLNAWEYLRDFNNFSEAESYFRTALSEAEAGKDNRRILRAVLNLMEIYWTIGKPAGAAELEGKCVAAARALAAGEAACLRQVGNGYYELGEYRKAIGYHEKALGMHERIHPARDHPDVAALLNNLGANYFELGDYRKAMEYHERSLAMRQRVYAARDRSDVAALLNNLGANYQELGDYRKAMEYHERSLAMRQRVYAARDHIAVALSLSNVGLAYSGLAEYPRALGYHEKALAMRERMHGGRDHPDVASSISNLGVV